MSSVIPCCGAKYDAALVGQKDSRIHSYKGPHWLQAEMGGTLRLQAGLNITWMLLAGIGRAHQFLAWVEGARRLQAAKQTQFQVVRHGFRIQGLKDLGGISLRPTDLGGFNLV